MNSTKYGKRNRAMSKIIRIENCSECPHEGRYACNYDSAHANIKTKHDTIPDNCPLPDDVTPKPYIPKP
jgi:hypothetical protein